MSVDVEFVGGFGRARDTLLATTLAYARRSAAYAIEIIRAPLFPLAYFGTMYLTYSMTGRQTVDGPTWPAFSWSACSGSKPGAPASGPAVTPSSPNALRGRSARCS